MPEKEEKLSNEPMVDLDTSGPGASVDLPETQKEEEKTYEKEEEKNETNVTYDDQPADTSEKSDEQSDVRDSEDIQKSEGGKVTQEADEAKSDKQQITLRKLKSILKELRKE